MAGRDVNPSPFSIPNPPSGFSKGWERPEKILLEFRGLSHRSLALHCLHVVVGRRIPERGMPWIRDKLRSRAGLRLQE